MFSRAGPLALLLISAVRLTSALVALHAPPAPRTLRYTRTVPDVLSCTNTDPCVVDCTGCIGTIFVPDPDNCRGYYICVNDELFPEPFHCDEGEMFSPTAGLCVPGECTESCFYSSCHYECLENNVPVHGSIADRYNCSRYTSCNNDGTEGAELTCSAQEPFFDGEECQTDETRCCACRPYCSSHYEVGSLIIDPADCTKYFICGDIGIPEIWGKCEPGEHFDPQEGRCSDNVPCFTYCTNVLDPYGCIHVFTCQEVGFFTKCQEACTPEFYFCGSDDINNIVEARSCEHGEVFHPYEHNCVPPSECPF